MAASVSLRVAPAGSRRAHRNGPRQFDNGKSLSIFYLPGHGVPGMIKLDIVNEVSKIADITKVKAELAVDAVFDAMSVSMQRGERIELRGFGVFQVKPRKRGI